VRDFHSNSTIPDHSEIESTKLVLEVLPGWKTDVSGVKTDAELPKNCKKDIEFY
jgi:adenylosuccinate synthase